MRKKEKRESQNMALPKIFVRFFAIATHRLENYWEIFRWQQPRSNEQVRWICEIERKNAENHFLLSSETCCIELVRKTVSCFPWISIYLKSITTFRLCRTFSQTFGCFCLQFIVVEQLIGNGKNRRMRSIIFDQLSNVLGIVLIGDLISFVKLFFE